MSPTPDRLRAAADALVAMAGALTADVADLLPLGGLSTWRGPAADRHRAAALTHAGRVEAAGDELWRTANRLRNEAATAEAHLQEVVAERERRYRAGVDR